MTTAEQLENDPVRRMWVLFAGNTRSSGRYDPRKDRSFTEDGALMPADIKDHLSGKLGCGAVPIMDDDTCLWAAIDIDNHGTDEDIDICEIDEKIRTQRLPLVPCRSKSGGVHVYLFLTRAHPANRIQAVMKKWAGILGYADAEIFPKQGRLSQNKEGVKQLGNWINFPYFDAAKTNRYCVHEGKKLDFEQFLKLAEKKKATETDLHGETMAEHPDAPPCIQRMMVNGVAQGHRNEAIYAMTVYLKKSDPATAEARARDANLTIFHKPIGKSELTRTINSALRKDCQYRCQEEPARTLCEREVCMSRKFGITPVEADQAEIFEALPEFSGLVKYMTEPIRWEMKVDGVKITNVMTPQLLEWRAMREMIADKLTKIVPLIKPQEWERILVPLMQEARIIEVPDEASINGVIRDRLREFAAKTDLINRGEDKEDRKALLRGLPVVQKYQGERYVMFRMNDFVNYLKRTKAEELKGVNLWFAIKEMGVEHTKFRAGDENINVYCLPVSQVLNGLTAEPPAFRSEL